MAKRKALGRGLEAMIPTDPQVEAAQTSDVRIDKIEPNPYQPRLDWDDEKAVKALEELSASIKEHGVIQPITVRKMGNKFQLISGERRWRASKMAGLKDIPAYVREANDEQMLEMALIENIQREDLNAMEIALSYQRLINELGIKQEEVAGKVGKDRTTVTNYLSLLKMSPALQQAVRKDDISRGHAIAIRGLKDENLETRTTDLVVQRSLSVRQTEAMTRLLRGLPEKLLRMRLLDVVEEKSLSVKQAEAVAKAISSEAAKAKEQKEPAAMPSVDDILLRKAQNKLGDKFERPIKIQQKKDGTGDIVISYDNANDLSVILSILDISMD